MRHALLDAQELENFNSQKPGSSQLKCTASGMFAVQVLVS